MNGRAIGQTYIFLREDRVGCTKTTCDLAERGLDFATISLNFFASALVRPAKDDCFVALGRLGHLKVAVIFKPLGTEALSVISLRPASERERRLIP